MKLSRERIAVAVGQCRGARLLQRLALPERSQQAVLRRGQPLVIQIVVVWLAAGVLLAVFGISELREAGPGAAIALVLGGNIAWMAVRRLRRAWRVHVLTDRLMLGLCPHCAYDLRASPDRCPECGTPLWIRRSNV